MKPEEKSKDLLAKTRSKAKMYEYDVPDDDHIKILDDPSRLMRLTLGNLGDLAANINSDQKNKSFEVLKKELQFSAQFFDSYFESKLNNEIDAYLIIIGSASYYLCDLPGSSKVLADRLPDDFSNLDCSHLELLLLWLLKGNFTRHINVHEGKFTKYISKLTKIFKEYYFSGKGEPVIQNDLISIRKVAYENGTARELLFVDIICSIIRKRIENSSWKCLPRYTNLTISAWSEAIKKDSFIKELWPAQHILGEHGVLSGKSAIVQMPTSAGKTKAVELIIRSAFLSGRASVVVIVAPFRALCHEIKNELVNAFKNEEIILEEVSDIFQFDFDIRNLSDRNILVLTPEKIMYMLRQSPELSNKIGLLIYDEGHLFDDETRGVTYELLLSSLKTMVSEGTQTVLISAVINNAEEIGKWIYGENGTAVFGNNLLPTYRSIAFASWQDVRGRLEFVDNENPDEGKFYVPRVIEQVQLNLNERERSVRYFPDREDDNSIALYLGVKLISKGSVAIFCGRKDTVLKLCETIVKSYQRGLSFASPLDYSIRDEVDKLYFLHKCNLGEISFATQSSKLGIYAHSANIPHGIRLAVEYAMQKAMIKFVICTSTLAQGVNLPIRYLILTSIYQAGKKIKVRDFHNLIGRVGRSGMYTEGSIIFSDPHIFDQKKNLKGGSFRWKEIKKLLDPKNSEQCMSAISIIFSPIYNEKKTESIEINLIDYVKKYIDDASDLNNKLILFAQKNKEKGYTEAGVLKQAQLKTDIFASIESYLMAYWEDNAFSRDIKIEEFVTQTLAYQLCNEEQRDVLIILFDLIAKHIKDKVPDANECRTLGKTLYGLNDSIKIKLWVSENINKISESTGHKEMLDTIWPIITEHVKSDLFKKITPKSSLKKLIEDWVEGKPYFELHQNLEKNGARLNWGTKKTRAITLEKVISLCDHAMAYESMLLIGAIIELYRLINPVSNEDAIMKIGQLQKRLKYGLPSNMAVTLYEIGFTDRVIATELSYIVDVANTDDQNTIKMIDQNAESIKKILAKYPSYYRMILDRLIEK